ncbi:MAG: Holliday junction branch migration protein RuvA [Bacteroidales bacterium]
MYEYIEGNVVEVNPARVVLESSGIGYELLISLNTFTRIKDEKQVRLYTHLTIKNEATTPVGFSLFGFADKTERSWFRMLVSVSGVGNNTALLVLSALTSDDLYQVISHEDTATLQKVKGIGAKSASRIIIDLKDKLDKTTDPVQIIPAAHNTVKPEALSGLILLGFQRGRAVQALDKVEKSLGPDTTVEEMIKEALKIL